MSTTSGLELGGERDAGAAVVGLPDDLEVVGAGECRAHAVEEQRVVVDEQDAGHRASIGSSARMRVPDPVFVTTSRPPISSARWRIEVSPSPSTRGRSGQADPVVLDLQRQPGGGAAEVYGDPAGAGVPDRVGERLGRDPVASDLDRGRQRPVHVDVHVDGGAGRGHPVRQPAQAGPEPEVVQHGGAEVVGDGAYVVDGGRDAGGRGLEQAARDRVGHQVACGLDLQAHAGQRGADTVVQVAAQPASFLLAGGHERGPAVLEPVGEPQCGDGRGDLVADDGQQLGVAGGTLVSPGGR